jgi:hypothetical protein
MNYLSYRIGLFKLNRKRKKEVSIVSKLAAEARKTGGDRKAQEVWQSESFDIDMIDDEILALRSRYLISKAFKRFLPTPGVSEKDGMWEHSNFTGKYHLTEEGIREVHGMIRKDTKEIMELLSYWSPWIGLLIGLIGAITGLVAIIKR